MAIVVLGAVVTLLIVVLRDQLIRSWAEGPPHKRRVRPTRGLVLVLTAFLRGGYNWARIALTLTLFFLAVGTIAGLRTGAPATFMVFSVISFPLEAAAVYFLWHKDTSAYLRGAWVAREELSES
jgi:hypothetical protein